MISQNIMANDKTDLWPIAKSSPKLWDKAQERLATDAGYARTLNPKQVKNHAPIIGAIGEQAIEWWLDWNRIPFEPNYTPEHDLTVAGFTAEIKTKRRTVKPQADYDCSVNSYDGWRQHPDLFFFVSVFAPEIPADKDSIWAAYLVGWCWSSVIEDQGRRYPSGTVDERNGATLGYDAINIAIGELRPMIDLGELI